MQTLAKKCAAKLTAKLNAKLHATSLKMLPNKRRMAAKSAPLRTIQSARLVSTAMRDEEDQHQQLRQHQLQLRLSLSARTLQMTKQTLAKKCAAKLTAKLNAKLHATSLKMLPNKRRMAAKSAPLRTIQSARLVSTAMRDEEDQHQQL